MARPAVPAGPGAGRGTGSPAGLTTSGVSGGVSGSRPFLGVSRVHSQGNAGAAGDWWRWAVRLQSPHKGGGLEGQPRRAHFCGWEAGAWAASASAPRAQPALNPGRQQSTAVPRWPTGSCQHAFYFSTLRERGQFDLICCVVCITGPLQRLCLDPGPDTGLDWRVPHRPPVPSAPQPIRHPQATTATSFGRLPLNFSLTG